MKFYRTKAITVPEDVEEILSKVGSRNISPYISIAIKERDRAWRRAIIHLQNAGYTGATIRDMLKGWEYAIVLLKRDDKSLEHDLEILQAEKNARNESCLDLLDSI